MLSGKRKKLFLQTIFVLCLVGLGVSFYLLNIHYAEGTGVCDINETFSCHTVNTSKYSVVFGIPVALLGALGYTFMGFLALGVGNAKKWKFVTKGVWKQIVQLRVLFAFALISFLFSLYLTYVESFILHTYCIFCLVSQLCVVLIALLSYSLLKSEKKR